MLYNTINYLWGPVFLADRVFKRKKQCAKIGFMF